MNPLFQLVTKVWTLFDKKKVRREAVGILVLQKYSTYLYYSHILQQKF